MRPLHSKDVRTEDGMFQKPTATQAGSPVGLWQHSCPHGTSAAVTVIPVAVFARFSTFAVVRSRFCAMPVFAVVRSLGATTTVVRTRRRGLFGGPSDDEPVAKSATSLPSSGMTTARAGEASNGMSCPSVMFSRGSSLASFHEF